MSTVAEPEPSPVALDRAPPAPPARVAGIVAGNHLRRMVRNRTALLMGILTPLLMATVIGLAFGGGISFNAKIAIVDSDGSSTSTAIVDGLVQGIPPGTPVQLIRGATWDAERDALASGNVDAVIEVPPGFGAAIPAMATGGPAPTLRVLTDANKQIAGDVARSIADGMGARIGTSVLAVATALDAKGNSVDPASIQSIVQAAQEVPTPIVLAQVNVGERYAPVAYFGASMGILFLFFTVGGGARNLITERKEGTLDRMRVAPVTDGAVLLGTSLAVLIVALASLVTIWVVTTVVFRASWGDPIAVLAVLIAAVFAIAGISALVAGLARTDAQADGMTAVVAFGFALLGGSFLQPGSLPPLLERLTFITPNGWALRALTRIGAGGANVVDVLPHIAVLLVIGAVTTTIGVRAISARALR